MNKKVIATFLVVMFSISLLAPNISVAKKQKSKRRAKITLNVDDNYVFKRSKVVLSGSIVTRKKGTRIYVYRKIKGRKQYKLIKKAKTEKNGRFKTRVKVLKTAYYLAKFKYKQRWHKSKTKVVRIGKSAHPDSSTNNITWTLPPTASKKRLSLPFTTDELFYSDKTGIGGFGLHAGGHIEGLDHVWIELKPGTPVRSWADGTVKQVRSNNGEYHITIDYGSNLEGTHMEVKQALVSEGQEVKQGQTIAVGMSFDPEQTSAELSLIDRGRNDGVKVYDGGVYVSPFDYLNKADKKILCDAYKAFVLDPYLQSGASIRSGSMFEPYQPYLTNKIFIHEKNKLTGVWFYEGAWQEGTPYDLMTLIEANASNPYYSSNKFLVADRSTGSNRSNNGTFTVDYASNRLVISTGSKTYYGIFAIDESADRAKLTIEYQEGSYPASFSANALGYIERSNQMPN